MVVEKPSPIKPNVWEFVRGQDGTYAVFQNGQVLSDFISEEALESEICVRYGFWGREYNDIRRQLARSGKCAVDLSC